MEERELVYLTALNLAFRYQGSVAQTLLAHFGEAEAIFHYTPDKLKQATGLTVQACQKLLASQTLTEARNEIEWTYKQGIKTYTIHSPNYPKRLKHCPDAPVILYQKGAVDLSADKILAVVGTRNATPYGEQVCHQLIHGLAKRGHQCIIVSGLAYGIDACAHKAALEAGLPTVAVFAFGLDNVQPSAHYNLAKSIEAQGACVSDFPSKTTVVKSNFIKRNRIIAGLADGVLLVESREKGGALSTASIALSYDREVMAVPGRMGDRSSEGCNNLIKNQGAALVQSVEDIETQLGWTPVLSASTPPTLPQERDLIDFGLLQSLQQEGPLSLDLLHRRSQIPLPELSARLMRLVLKGSIKRLSTNQYALLNP
jgi:DNA protecting protein DprA